MSRLTFRNAAGDVAWQKQLRDRYLADGVPPVPHLSVKKARVRPVSRKVAKQIILKYEWLGTMAPGLNHYYGIFFGPFCAGVTCFAVPFMGAGVNVHKGFGIKRERLAYLARGANVHWSPRGANSKLVSWSCKLLGQQTPAKMVIAYSDLDAGEIGTIYQACNWVCVGRGGSIRQLIAPNGRVYDRKFISNHALRQSVPWQDMRGALLDAGWREQDSNPKYRYVYVLDKGDQRLIDLVESKRVPYPKRHAAEVTQVDTPGDQSGEGGAVPTRPLTP